VAVAVAVAVGSLQPFAPTAFTPDSRDLGMQSAIHNCRRAATARSEPMVVAVIAQAGQRLAGGANLKIAAR
jgi:hypothetical protein